MADRKWEKWSVVIASVATLCSVVIAVLVYCQTKKIADKQGTLSLSIATAQEKLTREINKQQQNVSNAGVLAAFLPYLDDANGSCSSQKVKYGLDKIQHFLGGDEIDRLQEIYTFKKCSEAVVTDEDVTDEDVAATINEKPTGTGWVYLGSYKKRDKKWETIFQSLPQISDIKMVKKLDLQPNMHLNVRGAMPNLFGKKGDIINVLSDTSQITVEKVKYWGFGYY